MFKLWSLKVKKFKGSDKGIQGVLSSDKTKKALRGVALSSGVWDETTRQFARRNIDMKETSYRTASRVKVGLTSDNPDLVRVGTRDKKLREAIAAKIASSTR